MFEKHSVECGGLDEQGLIETLQALFENAVVIFDEAHNLESVCSDASSWSITGKHLADATAELRRCAAVHGHCIHFKFIGT